MNSTQRGIIVVGVIAMAVVLLHAPFRYVGHEGIVSQSPRSGTVFYPVFAPPAHYEIVHEGTDLVFIDAAEVNSGSLALIWAGIAIAAGLAIMFARSPSAQHVGTSQVRQCPQCAETIQRAAIKCRFCGADVAPQP